MDFIYILVYFPSYGNNIDQIKTVFVASEQVLVEERQKLLLDQGAYAQNELKILRAPAYL